MIDSERIGRAIRTLRLKAGYTQRELADRLFISDVAVSKWERGKSVPDTATLMKLATLLDMDVDGLLDGTASYSGDCWLGVLLLDGSGLPADARLWDKPLIDYQLSYFLLAGIRDLRIACPEPAQTYIRSRFRDGEILGMQLHFVLPEKLTAAEVLSGSGDGDIMFIYEPFFLYGVNLTRFLQRAMQHKNPAVELASVVGKGGAPLREGFSQYEYQTLPLAFLQRRYLMDCGIGTPLLEVLRQTEKAHLRTEPMDKGFLFSPLRDERDSGNVSVLVKCIQELSGYYICCPQEIAWRRGILSGEQMKKEAAQFPEYREYLNGLV